MKEQQYRVEFAIDVWAVGAESAAQIAWDLLTSPDAMLPVGTVTNPDGESEDIDLQEIYDNEE